MQPLTLDDQPRGVPVLTIDSVGAGVGEKVLIVIEGKAAGDALRRKAAPVDAAIIGIVDHVTWRRERSASMTDQELRALVRDAVARHLGARAARAPRGRHRRRSQRRDVRTGHTRATRIYLTVINATDACVIEPSVPCNHCGYCKSHGH